MIEPARSGLALGYHLELPIEDVRMPDRIVSDGVISGLATTLTTMPSKFASTNAIF